LEPLVIVGASLAGLRAADAARRSGWEGEVVVVGEEGHMPYTRPPLSKELLTKAEASLTDHLLPAQVGHRAAVAVDGGRGEDDEVGAARKGRELRARRRRGREDGKDGEERGRNPREGTHRLHSTVPAAARRPRAL